ncbi:c-type cytochrome [Phaeovulum sp.]|uniref:c-type cytochrome n=1 Tax=Phaeovulum sp. TaxID=2934796 RepID=UPI0039E56C23
MKISLIAATFAALALTTAANADDIKDGKKEFNKCKACHAIKSDTGEDIVKGGKVGPNLYGIVGKAVASTEDFKYGDGLKAVGETGMVWTPEELEVYMTDPTAWIDEKLGDTKAKSLMTHKQKKKQEEIVAFLESVVTE